MTDRRWLAGSIAMTVAGLAALFAAVSLSEPSLFLATVGAVLACVGAALTGSILSTRRITREVLASRAEALKSDPGDGADVGRLVGDLVDSLRYLDDASAQQRVLFDEILGAMGEGLLAIDRHGRVVLANRRLQGLFEHHRSPVGLSFLEVVRSRRLADAFDRALEGGSTSIREAVGRPGHERTVEMRVFPARGGAEIAAAAVFIDVTQIERLERIRRDFVDDFSHEVRTPLAGLRSAVESFDAGPRLAPDQEEQLRGVIRRQLSRLERLVENVAELNSIESGIAALHREKTNLRGLLENVADEFRERNPDRVIALSGSDLTADVDPGRVEQIVTNLVDNALKYGDPQGEVGISLGCENGFAVIQVTNEGDGIAPEDQERIFHRFYRLDKSRSSEVAGAGLGLAITKHLVLLHRGSIDVKSAPGEGATFVVRLPV